jgi:hypothetical protein
LHHTCAEVWLALKRDLVETAAADLERRDAPVALPPIRVESNPLSA